MCLNGANSRERTLVAAYLVLDITITDPELYPEYERAARPTVQAHGGKIVIRAVNGETVEGDANIARLVVVEFESMEILKRWYYSPEYQAAVDIRRNASTGNVIMMEGQPLPPPAI
jgi:uncharacterized protein (DUF1330 family)